MNDTNNIDDLFRSGLDDLKINPPEMGWETLDRELAKKRLRRKLISRIKYLSIFLILFFTGIVTYKFNSETHPLTDIKQKSLKTELVKNHNQIISENISRESTTLSETEKTRATQNIVQPNISSPGKQEIQNASELLVSMNVNAVSKSKNTPKDLINEEVKKEINHENKISGNQLNISFINPDKSDVTTKKQFANNVTNSDVSKVYDKNQENKNVSAKNEITNDLPLVISEDIVSIPENISKISEPVKKNENVAPENIIPEKSIRVIKDPSTIQPPETNLSAPLLLTTPPKEPAKIVIENEIKSPVDSGKNSSTTNSNYNQEQKQDSSASSFKKILSHLSVAIYFSPDYVNNRLKINDDYTGTASQNINDYDNQKAAFSYSAGMLLRYDLGRRWSIGSGISYSTFAETAVYNTINVISDSVYRRDYRHPQRPPGGHMITPSGGNHGGHNPHVPPGNNNHHYVIQTSCGAIDLYNVPPHHNSGNHNNGDTLNIKTKTSELLQFINIPLTLRYEFMKNKFSYFIEGGGAINFVKGDIVNIVVDDAYTETNERDGLKNLNYSLLFGVGIQYNFYKGLSTYLKPSLRYSITPVNQDNPLYSYPYYIGVEIGFSIHF